MPFMKLSTCRRVGRPAALDRFAGKGGSPYKTSSLERKPVGRLTGSDNTILKTDPSILKGF